MWKIQMIHIMRVFSLLSRKNSGTIETSPELKNIVYKWDRASVSKYHFGHISMILICIKLICSACLYVPYTLWLCSSTASNSEFLYFLEIMFLYFCFSFPYMQKNVKNLRQVREYLTKTKKKTNNLIFVLSGIFETTK